MLLGVSKDLSDSRWLGLAHGGEKSYLMVFLAMKRASSREVRCLYSQGIWLRNDLSFLMLGMRFL